MDITSIITQYQGRFIAQHGYRLTREQRHALASMLACRTAQCGEVLLDCPTCHEVQTRYRSCGNRSCPRCQHHDTARWLERQRQKLLPVDYFLVTFTLPYELRALARRHPAQVYGMLFACAQSTLATFAGNAVKLGGRIGMTAVLHTHTRKLDYHPHVHLVVPGGCLMTRRRQCSSLVTARAESTGCVGQDCPGDDTAPRLSLPPLRASLTGDRVPTAGAAARVIG